MAGSTPQPVTRRQFLGACGAATASAVGTSAIVGGQPTPPQPGPKQPSLTTPSNVDVQHPDLGSPGSISPRGQKAIAAVDRMLQREQAQMSNTVRAVEDLGLDPGGNSAVDGALNDALGGMANTRLEFPNNGTFRIQDSITANPDGPIEIIGNGSVFKLDQGTVEYGFNFDLPSGSVVDGVTVDQSADGARSGFKVGTEGTIDIRNVTIKGFADPTPADQDGTNILVPVARGSGSTIRISNFKAIGGTAAGLHSDSGEPDSAPENRLSAPIGVWVGQSTQGTVQLVNPRMRGWSNGTYSGRTDARVEVHGGVMWNNYNCQVRISGNSFVDGTTMILDGREWDMNENPGPYSLGKKQSVLACRVDPGGNKGDQSGTAIFRNLEVKAKQMDNSPAIFDWEGSAGAGKIENCRITTHMDVPLVLGEEPGSQFNYNAASQTNIEVSHCMIKGQSPAAVMEMEGRPDSRISQTCINLPNAGPDSINGAISGKGVSFGQCSAQSVLTNPGEIGSNANVSSLPAPNVTFSGTSIGAPVNRGPSREDYREQQRNWALKWIYRIVAVAAALAFVILILFFMLRSVLGD